MTSTHPLASGFTLWYMNRDTRSDESYEEQIKKIGTFHTVIYHISLSLSLYLSVLYYLIPLNCSYHLNPCQTQRCKSSGRTIRTCAGDHPSLSSLSFACVSRDLPPVTHLHQYLHPHTPTQKSIYIRSVSISNDLNLINALFLKHNPLDYIIYYTHLIYIQAWWSAAFVWLSFVSRGHLSDMGRRS